MLNTALTGLVVIEVMALVAAALVTLVVLWQIRWWR